MPIQSVPFRSRKTVERKFAPMVYVIEEENEPEGFRDMVFKLGIKDGVIELRTTVSKKEERQEKKWWHFFKRSKD